MDSELNDLLLTKYCVVKSQIDSVSSRTVCLKKTLENTVGTIKNGQSRETGNIGYTRRRKTKQKHNTICVGQHYIQTNIINVNSTCAYLQTTVGKN